MTVARRACALAAATAMVATIAGCGRTSTDSRQDGDSGDHVVSIAKCQDYQPTAGITKDKILLGSSFPSSGPLAVLAKLAQGYRAYFKYVNAKDGGIGGRKIEVVSYDDAYDPSRTVSNVNRLINEDKVFALVGVPSTPGNFAFWDRTEASCVPNLMASTAAADYATTIKHRWTLNGLVPYHTEGQALAQALHEHSGAKKVAVLYQAGDFGGSMLKGVEAESSALGMTVVSKESFQATDPSVTTQITSLAATGADALVVVAAGTPCAQALDAVSKTSWKPQVAVSYTCTSRALMKLASPAGSEGILSVTPFKDPSARRWSSDEGAKTYRESVKTYEPDADPEDSFVANGWFYGEVVYAILKNARSLTRQDVMDSALSLSGVTASMALPGVTLTTGSADATPVESVQLQRYDAATHEWQFMDGGSPLQDGQTKILTFDYAKSSAR
ncbi:ABC transporter substrate-binding protein [Microtetraspora malaysiensis]|uniref:ABC transporter substrate-binding protein n=1 Tax=Microtetraspora malaysiensis TaxID=161358 RepID=UPI003D9212B4